MVIITGNEPSASGYKVEQVTMSDPHVPLISCANQLQKTLIEDVLKDHKIPFTCVDATMAPIFGQHSPLGYQELRVPSDRLQEAKDILCANDIVCEVSERLLRRTMDEVVLPLLQSRHREYDRLLHLTRINNKETVQAIFRSTLEHEGGRELLDEFFFALAAEGSPRLLSLARILSVSASEEFLARYVELACDAGKEDRISLLEVVHVFPESSLHAAVILKALLDPDHDIREAGSEALYNVTGSSWGYEPDDPPETREEVVREIYEKLSEKP